MASSKPTILFPYNPAFVLLGVYSDERNADVYLRTYPQMFLAVLLVIATTWNQPRYRAGGPTNRLWFHADDGRLLSAEED